MTMLPCPFCKATLSLQTQFCPHCGKLQVITAIVADNDISNDQTVLATSLTLFDKMQENLDEYKAQLEKQQGILDKLPQEMREELEKHHSEIEVLLARKVDKTEEVAPVKLSRRQVALIILFFGVTGIFLLLFFSFLVVNTKPEYIADIFTLISTSLTLIGGLYLAYDLLGRQNGPLVWLTTYMTYALIGMMAMAPIVLLGVLFSDVVALNLLFVGGMLGIGGDLIMRKYTSIDKPRFLSMRALFIESVASITFWCLLLGMLNQFPSGTSSPLDFLFSFIGYSLLPVTIPTIIIVHCFRYFVVSKPISIHNKNLFFAWKVFWAEFLVAYVLWFLCFLLIFPVSFFTLPVLSAIPAIASAIAAGFARFTLQWANSLGNRRLGTFGLCLLSVGVILTAVPSIIDLLK